jgi:beta-glucosidase
LKIHFRVTIGLTESELLKIVRLALEAARESIVLMKNDEKALPLSPDKMKNILLAGPLANLKSPLAGGWTLRWINQDESSVP